MLSGCPLAIALVNAPSSAVVALAGSVALVAPWAATAMPAPCRPLSGQLWALVSQAPELRYSTSV
jgi:hypothetical protein